MDKRTLFRHWGIDFVRELPELTPPGSPNRSVRRFAFEAEGGGRYIAEFFELRKKNKQIRQNEMLEFCRQRHLPGIFPWWRSASDGHGVNDGGYWVQLRPWIAAGTIPRENLGENSDFALLCGNYLLQMQQVMQDYPAFQMPNDGFVFASYLPKLLSFTARRMPEFLAGVEAAVQSLDHFWKLEKSWPQRFAHGDFHPGNILMNSGRIAAVIDWEFAGIKCAGYDLALLLGCLGMDDPSWLNGKFSKSLQNLLYANGYMPQAVWENLTALMAAIRLGWLGEWIELGDRELVAQELVYIRMLAAQ